MKKYLKECLKIEKKNNIGNVSRRHIFYVWITRQPCWLRWKFVKYLRYCSYYFEKAKHNFLYYIPFIFYLRKKNKLGNKLGFEMSGRNISPGLTLFHNGPIVIHGNAIIGKNCLLHGDNCIGNNGKNDKCPVIADDVDIGVGAKIIGDVFIASKIKIGAGAVVVNSFYEEGITIAGIPAKKVKNGR